MSKTKPLSKALRAASSPEARAKAVATMKRRREEREKLATYDSVRLADGSRVVAQEMSLDDIPDGKVKKKYTKKAGHTVTEKEWMFLQVAKLLLKE